MSKKAENGEMTLQTNAFRLPMKVVVIRFYPRATAMVQNPGHVLYGGLGPQATKYFQLPMSSTGGYINPFNSVEEREYLEKMMGLPEGGLSPGRKVNNFFDEYVITLSKADKVLDLNNPDDYLFFLVANTQRDYIAENVRDIRNRATYHWYFLDENTEREVEALRINSTSRAWIEYGKIESSSAKLKHVLVEYRGGSNMPSKANDIKWLQTEVGKLIESDATSFLNIIQDPNLQYKIDIYNSVHLGILKKDKGYYFMEDGTKLSLDGEDNSLDGAIRFLKAPENNEYHITLRQRIENAGGV